MGGRGTQGDSFVPSLGTRQHIMCLHAPTFGDGLSLYCAAQRDNGSLNTKVDDGRNTVST